VNDQGGKVSWKKALSEVLRAHNGTRKSGAVASAGTKDKRHDDLFKGFTDLRRLGYKLEDVRQFKGKHMHALVQFWEREGLAPATIQNKISVFRSFAGWIGKSGMIEKSELYTTRHGSATRSTVNRIDKSWDGNGVDVDGLIAKIAETEPRVALQLELQNLLGLRCRESWQLKPHLADQGGFLLVNLGTKGGRDRIVPVDSPEKRAVLEKAKSMCGKTESSMDPMKNMAQWKNHYYAIIRAHGISRRSLGVTSHGLRHGYAIRRYEDSTGEKAPVQGGKKIAREEDQVARIELAEELGHSRGSITSAYIGRA